MGKKGLYCSFDDDNRCLIDDFYSGKCGNEYRKELLCVKKGETVWIQFEECCGGLEPSGKTIFPWNKISGQPSCVKKLNFFQKLWKEILDLF